MDSQLTRRRLLRTIAAGIGTGLLVSRGALPVAANSGGWPQFGYDAGNTGYNPEAVGPGTDPEVLWEHSVRASEPVQPVVTGGNVYFAVENSLICLDAEDGTELWTYEEDELITAPAIRDGVLYTVTDDGTALAVAAENGRLQWETELPGSDAYQPTIAGDSLFITDRTHLYRIRKNDGELQWELTVEGFRQSIRTVPVVTDDGLWFAGSRLTQIRSTEEFGDTDRDLSGEENWDIFSTFNDEQQIALQFNDPTLGQQIGVSAVNETVYLPSRGVQAIDSISREVEWDFDEAVIVSGSPTVVDDSLYIGAGLGLEGGQGDGDVTENAGNVYSLDRSDGTVNWETDLGERINTSLSATSDTLYVGTEQESAVALDRQTGDELWRLNVGDSAEGNLRRVTGVPVVAHDQLYIGTREKICGIGQPNSTQTPTPTPTATPTPTPEEIPTPTPDKTPGDDSTSENSDDRFGPGFGLLSALGGLGSVTYLLNRRHEDNDD